MQLVMVACCHPDVVSCTGPTVSCWLMVLNKGLDGRSGIYSSTLDLQAKFCIFCCHLSLLGISTVCVFICAFIIILLLFLLLSAYGADKTKAKIMLHNICCFIATAVCTFYATCFVLKFILLVCVCFCL